ncbi:MAG: NAD(P)-dependent oxidoreductase [Vulcanimicrobiaceae bacterium]
MPLGDCGGNSQISPQDRAEILARTAGLWDDVRGRRIFMTGGTGFVGTWFVEAFAAANAAYALEATLVVLTRDPDRFRTRSRHLAEDRAIVLHRGEADGFDPPDGRFDFVVHAATERYHGADATRPLSIFDRDLAATRRVLTCARGWNTRRVLFTSSGAVYGAQGADVLSRTEDDASAPDPLDPQSVYGQSKRASEFACASFARVYGFDAVIARLFAFVGPHLPLDEGYAVGNFMRDALLGRPIAIGGDGTPLRSYLYAADLAVWLWTLLVRGVSGRAYNVGSSDALSIRDLARSVVRTIAPGSSIEIASVADPRKVPGRYVPSVARARDELGLEAWTTLEDALTRTFAYHRRAAPHG